MELTRQELIKAIESRHSVRQYDDTREIPSDILATVNEAMDKINAANPTLAFRLVADEPRAFGGRWPSYGNFKGVKHYIVIAGDKGKDTDILCGLKGEELVLLLQHLGLNSCWVGLTYKKIEGAFELPEKSVIRCLIAFGYGVDPSGRKHQIKVPDQVSNISLSSPKWFNEGVRLALLAPTAVNQQKFFFEYHKPDMVTAKARFSMIGYSNIDLGIALTHFKIGINNPSIKITIK